MTASRSRRFGAAVVCSSLFLSIVTPVAESIAKPVAKPESGAAAQPGTAAAPTPGDKGAPAAEAVPAAAPSRHGARSKAPDGTPIIFDKVSGAWRAPTLGEAWWAGDRFWRYDNGLWLTAPAAAGAWQLSPMEKVPEVARRYPPPKEAVTAKLPSGGEAVFEPRLKVFKVAGHKGVFLFDATFWRVDGGLWLGAASVDGPWAPVSPKPLPVPLRKAVGEPEEGQAVTLPGGEVVVWDAQAKVFLLKDKPTVALHDGRFYEKRDAQWFESAQATSGFEEKAVKDIPLAVRFKFRKEAADGAKPGKAGKGADKVSKKTAAERREGKAAGAKQGAAGKQGAAKKAGASQADDAGDSE